MSKEQFEAIYDALGDLEVNSDGYVPWSRVACVQREVGEMARNAPVEDATTTVLNHLISARTALKVNEPDRALDLIRRAIKALTSG